MTPMPGMPNPRVESDAKEGGHFVIYMPIEGKEIPHRGDFREVTRYSKLVFTWESPFSPAGSEVTIRFSENNEGGTQLNFTQVKFIDEQSRDNHKGGWTAILDTLDSILADELVH